MCIRKLSLLLLTVSALITATSALAGETIVIGAEDDWYPYSGRINGEARGFGVDVVRESFAAVGVTVKFESVPYIRCLELTKRGKFLACNEPARTDETEPHLLWPDQPIFSARSMIYARRPSTEAGLTTKSLEGRKVLVTHGFEYGNEFDNNKKVIRIAATKEISVFRMLLAGRGDYALAYEKVAAHIFRENPKEFADKFVAVGTTAETHMYCAFSKSFPDSKRYLALFNEGFAKIQKNGKYREIEKRW